MSDTSDFLKAIYPASYNPEWREKVARNLEAEAAWWRAGADATCVTGLDCSVLGAGSLYFRGWDVTSVFRRAQKAGIKPLESGSEDPPTPSP